jgi:hypothetical protein
MTPRAVAFDRLDEAAFVRQRLARLPLSNQPARIAYKRFVVAALLAARVNDRKARKAGWRLP